MRLFLISALSLFAAVCISCNGKTADGGGSGCSNAADCQPGEFCDAPNCVQVCRADSDCDDMALICEADRCITGARDNQPVINSIDADGPPDGDPTHVAHRVHRYVTINGENLDGVTATLADGTDQWTLEVCTPGSDQLVVQLPDDMRPGNFTLSVANQVGSCSATLPVLQGEDGAQGPQGIQGDPGVPCASCVDSPTIVDGGVAAADIAADAVDASKVADGSLTGADIDSTTTLTAAGFQLSAPVQRSIWLDAADASASKGGDATGFELYRNISNAIRIVFGAGDADTTLTPTNYTGAGHLDMGLYSHSDQDITFAMAIRLEPGDRMTQLVCYFLDQRTDSRVQAWIEKQGVTSSATPTLVGGFLHSGRIDSATQWTPQTQALDETVDVNSIYRLRGELNVIGSPTVAAMGFRGCRLSYETTRP